MIYRGTIVLSVLFASINASLYDALADKELEQYKYRNKLLHDQIIAEGCPNPGPVRVRRAVIGDDGKRVKTKLEVEKKFYEDLTTMLIKCREGTPTMQPTPKQETTALPTTKPVTRDPTTSAPAPTAPPATNLQPDACKQAINLTESWRQDHNSSNIEAIDGEFPQCDTREMDDAGNPWFRFTGEAGNKLLNFCVDFDSCGTNFPLWSDDPMPIEIGVVTRFQVYSSVAGECRHESFNSSVVRCSDSPTDFVYRWEKNVHHKFYCFYGFCGMTA